MVTVSIDLCLAAAGGLAPGDESAEKLRAIWLGLGVGLGVGLGLGLGYGLGLAYGLGLGLGLGYGLGLGLARAIGQPHTPPPGALWPQTFRLCPNISLPFCPNIP